jgi:hypothetical protein
MRLRTETHLRTPRRLLRSPVSTLRSYHRNIAWFYCMCPNMKPVGNASRSANESSTHKPIQTTQGNSCPNTSNQGAKCYRGNRRFGMTHRIDTAPSCT